MNKLTSNAVRTVAKLVILLAELRFVHRGHVDLLSDLVFAVGKGAVVSKLAILCGSPTTAELCLLFDLIIFGYQSPVVFESIRVHAVGINHVGRQSSRCRRKERLCLGIAADVLSRGLA